MPEADTSRRSSLEGRDPCGERHPSGWRVRPGPDGRGAPPSPPRGRPPAFGPGLAILLALLVMINVVVAAGLRAQPTRVRIPYSPTFLAQVQAGNVSSVSSKGTTVR